jgi:hypothetical protein
MTWVAVAVVGGTLIGGYMQGEAAKSAAQTQADAAARAQGQLLSTGKEAADLYAPYTSKGITALNQISTDPYFTHQFNNQDLNANLAPGYGFRLGQGQIANEQMSNATGGFMGGNAQKALQDYTQNFASGEYANAFNQYQQQRSNIYSNLNQIAGYGMTGTQGQANAMLGTGTNIANVGLANANAQAASQISQGNIYGNVANTAGNMLGYTALNNMNAPQSSSAYMNSIGASGGSNQYFGSNSSGLGAGEGYSGMNAQLGLA